MCTVAQLNNSHLLSDTHAFHCAVKSLEEEAWFPLSFLFLASLGVCTATELTAFFLNLSLKYS